MIDKDRKEVQDTMSAYHIIRYLIKKAEREEIGVKDAMAQIKEVLDESFNWV